MPLDQLSLTLLEVKRSARRRTLSVEVHRDLRVVVRAPARCPDDTLERYIAEHRVWIERQLTQWRISARPPLAFRPGERHLYRGERLPLRLQPGGRSSVACTPAGLMVTGRASASPTTIASALHRWYHAEARAIFPALLARCHAHPRFARYPLPALHIRRMRRCWGTYSPHHGVTLNSALIQAPDECTEFVIFHELCHISYRGHGPRFRALMDSVVPDWQRRRERLEQLLGP